MPHHMIFHEVGYNSCTRTSQSVMTVSACQVFKKKKKKGEKLLIFQYMPLESCSVNMWHFSEKCFCVNKMEILILLS